MRALINRIYFSFPVQLAIMHVKKNHLMMVLWIMLIGFVTQGISRRFGIPYLFLDPEYLGEVNGLSFFITGICCGMFIMTFNISSYILNSFRFPFLASMAKPFQKYTINNFIFPLLFLIIYSIEVFKFQFNQQLAGTGEVLFEVFAFLAGVFLIIQLVLKYFLLTNKDIHKLFGVRHSDHEHLDELYEAALDAELIPGRTRISEASEKHWKVLTYLASPFKIRLVRNTSHYKTYMLHSVFRQNHMNAAFLELLTIGLFILLGLFRDYEAFQIPAAASLLMLFSMVMMISGVIRFWMKAWATTAVVAGFLIINFLSGLDIFNPESHIYGLDYNGSKKNYSINQMQEYTNDSIVNADISSTIQILEKWKLDQKSNGVEKPKLAIISVSGGGLRSSLFTFLSLQAADSVTNGMMFNQTRLITGSSGGMIAACYYRSLKLDSVAIELPKHADNISKDILNATTFSMIVSDLFLNIQREEYKGNSYFKDRGYAFERKLNRNIDGVFDRPISYFKKPEMEGLIPMVIMNPTIINDGRSLYVSPVGISYMITRPSNAQTGHQPLPDGIEYTRFFEGKHPEETRFSDLLRANATFPYIMPAVALPTEPAISIMDAGIRDNYGIRNATRFLYVFRDWISKNTGGVVFIQIRDNHKEANLENKNNQSILARILSPLQNLSGNFLLMQDYSQDEQLQHIAEFLDCKFDYVSLEVPLMDEKVALSWHLTEQEKNTIARSVHSPENTAELKRLKEIFEIGKQD
ncbi:MAG: hypothetical protein RL090_1296 [Bacteroidota bacterium]